MPQTTGIQTNEQPDERFPRLARSSRRVGNDNPRRHHGGAIVRPEQLDQRRRDDDQQQRHRETARHQEEEEKTLGRRQEQRQPRNTEQEQAQRWRSVGAGRIGRERSTSARDRPSIRTASHPQLVVHGPRDEPAGDDGGHRCSPE